MSQTEFLKRKNDTLEFAEILSFIKSKGIELSRFSEGRLFEMLIGSEKNEKTKGV